MNEIVKSIGLLFETFKQTARCAGSDGSMSASGSPGSGLDLRQGSKFSFEYFQSRG